jgi:cation diffusion facilitator family transporter
MMAACQHDICTGSGRERKVILIAFCINAAMFCAEFAAGIIGDSTALLADSLDMLADAAVYAISLYAIGRSLQLRSGAALTNGVLESVLGLGIIIEATGKMIHGASPDAAVMGIFSVLALGANLACFGLLARYRQGDINLRATWLCSRNDVLANTGVLGAAGLVALTGSFWPDLIIGVIIALIVIKTASTVALEAIGNLRTGATHSR